jgi:hypothetical protein
MRKYLPTKDNSLVRPANKAVGSFCGDRRRIVANIIIISKRKQTIDARETGYS